MALAEILGIVLETAVASTAAMLAVLALRVPTRRGFGAGVGYALWLLPVAAMLAVVLPPAREAAVELQPTRLARVSMQVFDAEQSPLADSSALWVVAWLAGAGATFARMALHQRRFIRALGTMRRREDGTFMAQVRVGLPAVIGVIRPRIVVPLDFDRGFDPVERTLMRAHERAHIAGGDLLANAAWAALSCVHWFNPLLPYAASRFRHDQELACDRRVVAGYPNARRAYGEAMLKTQLAAQPLPLGCHWGQGHPLKERIEMLKLPGFSRTRQFAGVIGICIALAATGMGAWAVQPAAPASAAARVVPGAGRVAVDMWLQVDEGDRQRFIQAVTPGVAFPFVFKDGPGRGTAFVTVTPLDATRSRFDVRLERGGRVAAQPRLVVDDGQQAEIAIGERYDSGFTGVRAGLALVAREPVQPRGASTAPAPASASVPWDGETPVYPGDALRERIGGKVVLLVDVDAEGRTTAVEVASSEPRGVFDQAAMDAARRWRFKPNVENGKAVPGRVRVPIEFRPDGPPTGEGAEATARTTSGAVATDAAFDWIALQPSRTQVRGFECDRVVGSVFDESATRCGIRRTGPAR